MSMIRLPMLGETPLSPSEAAYFYNDYNLSCQTTPNNLDMPVNAVNGCHAFDPGDHAPRWRVREC